VVVYASKLLPGKGYNQILTDAKGFVGRFKK